MPIILLHRINLEKNEKRLYQVEVRPDMFEGYVVIRTWGRTDGAQRQKIDLHPSNAAARKAAAKLLRKKRKRGYRKVKLPKRMKINEPT